MMLHNLISDDLAASYISKNFVYFRPKPDLYRKYSFSHIRRRNQNRKRNSVDLYHTACAIVQACLFATTHDQHS